MSDSPFMSFEQIWTMVHGRPPTPEELKRSRTRALMVLDEIKISMSDSQQIWDELEP